MSFFESNKYFIQNSYIAKTKGLSDVEKKNFYEKELKKETRNRIFDSLKRSQIHSNLKEKTESYREIFRYFGKFEFKDLLNSLYFDVDAFLLMHSLSDQVHLSKPSDYFDQFQILSIYDNVNVIQDLEEFLFQVFVEAIDINHNDWLNLEGDNENSVITKLAQWAQELIAGNNQRTEIEKKLVFVFFHYARLWNLKYKSPFNYKKAIILLFKLNKILEENINVKILINAIIIVRNILDKVLSPIGFCPINDNCVTRRTYKNCPPGYLKQLTSFNDFISGFNSFTDEALFERYIKLDKGVSDIYLFEEILERVKKGRFSLNFELKNYIKEHRKIKLNDFSSFEFKFMKHNYYYDIFFSDD